MDERAVAGLGGPFAALGEFHEQAAEVGVERGIERGVLRQGNGEGINLQFLPVS